jgi:hypothetical protein
LILLKYLTKLNSVLLYYCIINAIFSRLDRFERILSFVSAKECKER